MIHCYDESAPKAFIDIETQSYCPLETTHKFASHPSTRVLTCVVKVDGVERRMGPYLKPEDVQYLDKLSETHVFVAHNAVFDSAVLERVLGLPECEWWDTLPCARAAGFPGKLDELGKTLQGRGKDPNGKRLVDMLCILRPGQRPPAVGLAHQLLLDYNSRDVELLELVYHRTKGFGEPAVIAADHAVNQRGVPIRRDLLLKLRELYAENAETMGAKFAEVTGDVSPTSPKQVKEWLAKLGFKVDSLGKFAVRDFLANPADHYIGEDPDGIGEAMVLVRDALETRREVVRVGRGKADAALAGLEDDDRIREQFVYWGAHTGRWSGRGLQLHNMPALSSRSIDVRDVEFTFPAVAERARRATEAALAKGEQKVLVADVLNACLRRLVESDNLLVADYGAVEARGVAWFAGCGRMLELFADPRQSVYIDMGRAIFGRTVSKKDDPNEYNLSKIVVLGAGYGMSGAKFEAGCRLRGVSLAAMESRGIRGRDAITMYRKTYPEIPQLWSALGAAALACVRGEGDQLAGRCVFSMEGAGDMRIKLPSGRPLVYREARVEMQVPLYCKLYNMAPTPVPTVTFTSHRGWRNSVYGAKLAENIVQAHCRDMLAHSIVKCEGAGLRPFLHVHDELGNLASEDGLADMLRIMTVAPEWAEGFPVLAEGYSGPIWSKNVRGYRELNMLNGEVVK